MFMHHLDPMNIFATKLSPFIKLKNLEREMEQIFGERSFGKSASESSAKLDHFDFSPACDIEERETQYLLSLDLPGVKKEDVKIELHNNQLTVTGEKKSFKKSESESESESKSVNENRVYSERAYGRFKRVFTLPSKVDADKMEAFYEQGVLTLTIPKMEVSRPKMIEIRDNKNKKEELIQRPEIKTA